MGHIVVYSINRIDKVWLALFSFTINYFLP